MITTTIQTVPRIVEVITDTRVLEQGRVVLREQITTRQIEDQFGPLDWVAFIKRTPLPRSVAKVAKARRHYGWSSVLGLLGPIVLVSSFLHGPGRVLGFLLGPLMILGAAFLLVWGAAENHPNAPDLALGAMWGTFAVANARNDRWGWAALDTANLAVNGYRVYQRNAADRADREADEQYWAALADAPIEQRWEAAWWYYESLREAWAELRQIHVSQVPLKDYPATCSWLRAMPQSW